MDKKINYKIELVLYTKYIYEDTVSPSYGVIEKSLTLRVSTVFNSSIDIITKISWSI